MVKNQEIFSVIYLNGRDEIIGMEELFHGLIATSAVYPCEVVKKVLKQNAAALIFVHNHLILAGNNYYSLEDNNLI